MTSARSPFPTPTERLATYFDTAQPRDTFEDRDIDDIATLLEQCGHVASRCPRTYILFRTIGQLETVERLVNAGFSDQFFPVEARNLPAFLDLSVIQAVVQQQGIILTKSLDLENGRHRHFTPGETLPFEILGRLGSGGYGQVDRILSRTSFKQYALKRIRRRAAFGNTSSREAVKGFLNEMKILRGLEHRHIVQYIGSYTDKSYLGLVMSPVADTDLASYNARLCGFLKTIEADKSSFYSQDLPVAAEMSSNLRTFYGCLTAALRHLHEQSIRHKDIKPQNILVVKGNVLFTDFGLSRDFADDVGSTTSGVTPASARYCAPEVANYEARNTSSDIWSLGCVFLEMAAALQGLNVEWIRQFYSQSGSDGTHFHNNPTATTQLIEKLRSAGDPRDRRTLTWIEKMVILHKGQRPTAAQVMEVITSPETSEMDVTPNMFCGICCVPDLESDSLDSLADDFDITTVAPPKKSLQEPTQQRPIEDPQLSVLTTIQPEVSKKSYAQSTAIPETIPSVVATSIVESQPSIAKSSGVVIPAVDTSHANPPDQSPKDTKPNAGLVSTIEVSSTKTYTNPKPPQNTGVSSDENPLSSASSSSECLVSSQHQTAFDAEKSPGQEVIETESRVDKDINSDVLSYRLRRVFGQSIVVSTEYASHELVSLKTVGGATLSGRIPTLLFTCGNLLQNSFDRENILIRHRSEVPHPGHNSSHLYGYPYTWLRRVIGLDNDRQGYIKPLYMEECDKVLNAYLSTLPSPLIPQETMNRILQIVWGSDTREEKQRWLQITLLQMRPPYCLTVLFLLDVYASLAKVVPEDKEAIVEAYYESFFGPIHLSVKIEEWEKKFVLRFMITHAEYLLGGPIAGDTISEDNDSLLSRLTRDQASPIRADDSATDTMKWMREAHLGGSPTDIKRNRVVSELLAEGITPNQIERFSLSIDKFVKEDSSLGVLHTPLWIATRFAGVKLSTSDDFHMDAKFICHLPFVVVQCCRKITAHIKTGLSFNSLNRRYLKAFTCLSPEELHDQKILDNFYHVSEEPHNLSGHECGTLLYTYLSCLPEPIIPYSTLMISRYSISINSQSTLDKNIEKMARYIADLPRPNRETLVYLLLFLNNINIDIFEISRIFQPVIIRANNDDTTSALFALSTMIRNAFKTIHMVSELLSDIDSLGPSRYDRARAGLVVDKVRGSLPIVPRLAASPSYCVAIVDYADAMDDSLSLQAGDKIRIISRTTRLYGWWKGDVRGRIGIFHPDRTLPCKTPTPSDQLFER